MKRKTFDNYDYEEAFPVELDRDIQKKARKNFEKEHPLQVPDYEEQWKEQQEKLKEWELERLLKEGKVESLYRTTTQPTPMFRLANCTIISLVASSNSGFNSMPFWDKN